MVGVDGHGEREALGRRLTELRIADPELPWRLAKTRPRRQRLTDDGRLVLVAMDHPARGVTAAGGQPFAMADRLEILDRLLRLLAVPGVDGVLGSPDLIEELLVCNHLRVQAGGPDVLANRLLIGSLNRAGLAGSAFERQDFASAYTPRALADWHLDGGKWLLTLDLQSSGTFYALERCAQALNELDALGLPTFLEVLPVPGDDGERLVQAVGVAAALGSSSRRRWLKLPVVPDFARVARATTCPILLLGGSRPGTPQALARDVARCMAAGPNVRGVMIGRGLVFPSDGSSPEAAVAQVVEAVRG